MKIKNPTFGIKFNENEKNLQLAFSGHHSNQLQSAENC